MIRRFLKRLLEGSLGEIALPLQCQRRCIQSIKNLISYSLKTNEIALSRLR